jgi:hypothetical protein
MNVLSGKPVKAFIYQDQDAHIAAHQNFLQDPQTAAIIGQNPLANQITAAMQAHIAEHFGFKYRQMIEQQLGAPLPYIKEDDEQIPEEYEVQISRLVAQASSQLLQQNQAAAAQQQAQEQAQDPIVQMQMQELQIKAQEQQRKVMKDQTDAALAEEKLALERERVMGELEIQGTKMGIQMEKEKETAMRKEEYDGTKLGIDMMKSKEQNENQRLQAAAQLLIAAQNRNSKVNK